MSLNQTNSHCTENASLFPTFGRKMLTKFPAPPPPPSSPSIYEFSTNQGLEVLQISLIGTVSNCPK